MVMQTALLKESDLVYLKVNDLENLTEMQMAMSLVQMLVVQMAMLKVLLKEMSLE